MWLERSKTDIELQDCERVILQDIDLTAIVSLEPSTHKNYIASWHFQGKSVRNLAFRQKFNVVRPTTLQ